MTALDPTPVLTSRRDALSHLDDLRELVGRFLDRPSAEGLRLVSTGTLQLLRFETDEVFPELATMTFPQDRIDAILEGHDRLVERLNRLSWVVPGSAEVQTEALHLRHELLAHIATYNDLRLPRGSLINGT
jgi:hypothetical protein